MAPNHRLDSAPDAESGGARPDLLRRLNRGRLVEAIRTEGPLTRAALARHTGMSYPTILKVVAELTAEGLLEEGEWVQPSLGRPGKALAMAGQGSQIASIVLGVERCTVAAAQLDGTLVAGSESVFQAPISYRGLLDEIAAVLAALSRGADKGWLIGVGISLPGVIDREAGEVVVSPNLPWLNGEKLAADVENVSGLPVTLVRAMHAHYLAEAVYGEGRGVDDFIVVNFAGGIGMGVSAGGRFLDGGGGMSGELGHITVEPEGKRCGCGNRGCLETVASDRAVVAAASERYGRAVTMDEVVALSRSGDLEIDDVLNRAVDFFSIGMASAINLFNPRRVILYGHFMDVRDDLFESFTAAAKERAMAPLAAEVEILPPQRNPHGSQQIGAAAALIEELVAGRSFRSLVRPPTPGTGALAL
ncbi:MAG: ROK family transcriptional regulator [Verrucomicrobiales bacterium]